MSEILDKDIDALVRNYECHQFKINKIKAAEDQLSEAIYIQLRGHNPLSAHTLAAAALEILHDLTKVSYKKDEVLKASALHFNSPLIPKNLRKKTYASTRLQKNFLKHADKDFDKEHIFNPSITDCFIREAITILRMLQENSDVKKEEYSVFDIWFVLKYPIFHELLKLPELVNKIKSLPEWSDTKFWLKQLEETHETYSDNSKTSSQRWSYLFGQRSGKVKLQFC